MREAADFLVATATCVTMAYMSTKPLTSTSLRLNLTFRDRARVWSAIVVTSAVVALHMVLARL